MDPLPSHPCNTQVGWGGEGAKPSDNARLAVGRQAGVGLARESPVRRHGQGALPGPVAVFRRPCGVGGDEKKEGGDYGKFLGLKLKKIHFNNRSRQSLVISLHTADGLFSGINISFR